MGAIAEFFQKNLARVWCSIHNKLLIGFSVIVFLCVAYITFVHYNNEKLGELYEQTLTRSMIFNEFYSTFEGVNSSLEYIAKRNAPGGNDFNGNAQEFLRVALAVEKYFEGTAHHRNAIDLKYMTRTYAEQGGLFIELTRERDYQNAVTAYEKAKRAST